NVGEGKDAFTYSKDDTRELIAPEFDETITIDSLTDDEVTFTMKQASDNVRVLEYNVQLINKLTGEVEKTFNTLSLPMDDPYEIYKEYTISDLSPNTPYKLRVFADDSMYNCTLQDVEISDINATSMRDLVVRFQEEEEFANDYVVRKLDIHLTSVEHYEKKGADDKVIKHVKSFKLLLDYQKNNKLISDKAYNTLTDNADYVIRKLK